MACRNDAIVTTSLEHLVVAMELGAPECAEEAKLLREARFAPFNRGHDPEATQTWLQELEKISYALQYSEVDKVTFTLYTVTP